MRLFIAIRLSDDLRRALDGTQKELFRLGVRGNYTREENMHLTLAFIGEYPEAEPVLDALDAVSFSSFPLRLEGMGAFGDLWWAGLSDSPALKNTVRKIRHALADAGIPFDRKRFSAHITLLRRASVRSLPPVTVPSVSMTVKTVSLMRSDRGKNGMIYTEIGSIRAD